MKISSTFAPIQYVPHNPLAIQPVSIFYPDYNQYERQRRNILQYIYLYFIPCIFTYQTKLKNFELEV
jgi:hypothetical protein